MSLMQLRRRPLLPRWTPPQPQHAHGASAAALRAASLPLPASACRCRCLPLPARRRSLPLPAALASRSHLAACLLCAAGLRQSNHGQRRRGFARAGQPQRRGGAQHQRLPRLGGQVRPRERRRRCARVAQVRGGQPAGQRGGAVGGRGGGKPSMAHPPVWGPLFGSFHPTCSRKRRWRCQ